MNELKNKGRPNLFSQGLGQYKLIHSLQESKQQAYEDFLFHPHCVGPIVIANSTTSTNVKSS